MWCKTYLTEQIKSVKAEDNGVTAQLDKLVSMDGDVDVNQRKGKVITIFDVKLVIEYSGMLQLDSRPPKSMLTNQAKPRMMKMSAAQSLFLKSPMTPKKTSTLYVCSIPWAYRITRLTLLQFDIDIYSDANNKAPVKDLIRSKIVPQLRKLFAQIGPALIAEHGKDIQHAPGSNPSSGVSTPKYHVPTPSALAQPTTQATKKATVNTTTVTDTEEFRAPASELYQTFTDPQRIAAFTRAAPKTFDGAKKGGKFELFGGNVSGEYLELVEPTQIVQSWRLDQWPKDHYSRLEINFDQNDVDNVTVMRVSWSGVPIGQEEVTKRNWREYYVRSIKQTFG